MLHTTSSNTLRALIRHIGFWSKKLISEKQRVPKASFNYRLSCEGSIMRGITLGPSFPGLMMSASSSQFLGSRYLLFGRTHGPRTWSIRLVGLWMHHGSPKRWPMTQRFRPAGPSQWQIPPTDWRSARCSMRLTNEYKGKRLWNNMDDPYPG